MLQLVLLCVASLDYLGQSNCIILVFHSVYAHDSFCTLSSMIFYMSTLEIDLFSSNSVRIRYEHLRSGGHVALQGHVV